jgi:hypothetical protein
VSLQKEENSKIYSLEGENTDNQNFSAKSDDFTVSMHDLESKEVNEVNG